MNMNVFPDLIVSKEINSKEDNQEPLKIETSKGDDFQIEEQKIPSKYQLNLNESEQNKLIDQTNENNINEQIPLFERIEIITKQKIEEIRAAKTFKDISQLKFFKIYHSKLCPFIIDEAIKESSKSSKNSQILIEKIEFLVNYKLNV